MTFRFRAAAALDMRRKQEDTARLALAVAENAVILATQQAKDAADRVSDEGRKLVDAQREGTEAWRVQWHRAWIERQRTEAAARARDVSQRTTDARAALAVTREAMKKRRVLERLRDRSWHKFQKDEHDQHVRDMNELATLRFVAQIAEEGGTSAD